MEFNLKVWRAVKGMTQTELADAVGVSPQTILAWEQGKAIPRLDRYYKLHEVLSLNAEDKILFCKTT